MRVSVLLPVYNAEKTLRQAVDSILNQSLSDFELLLIDDGSRDRSPEIIRDYAQKDSRVKAHVNAENGGLIKRLNQGLSLATGQLVARMDADDEALPQRLEKQVAFLAQHSDIAVVGSWVWNMGPTRAQDRLVRLPYTSKQITQTLPRENCLYHPTVMMRRAEVLALGGYSSRFPHAEDYELWLRLSRRHRLANIPEPLLRYRLSQGGVTFNRRWDMLYSVLLAQESYLNPGKTAEQLARAAKARLGATKRPEFFANVLRASVEELVRLEQWDDALKLIENSSHEVPAESARQLREWVVAEREANSCVPA